MMISGIIKNRILQMLNQFELVSIKTVQPDYTIGDTERVQLGHVVRRILQGEPIVVESSDESGNTIELLERIEELADKIK